MDLSDFNYRTDDLDDQIGRLKALVGVALHLLPDSPSAFEHEEKLFAVLVTTYELAVRLEESIKVAK